MTEALQILVQLSCVISTEISGMPSIGMFPVKKEVKLVVLEAGLFKLNLLY